MPRLKRSIMSRVTTLEGQPREREIVPVFQDWHDKNFWHEGPDDKKPMTWAEVNHKFPGDQFQLLPVIYTKDWRTEAKHD